MIKKFLVFVLVLCFTSHIQAQSEAPSLEPDPAIFFGSDRVMEGKLRLLYFIGAAVDNLHLLRELDRVTGIYRDARLNGGARGLACIVVLSEHCRELSRDILSTKFSNLLFLEGNHVHARINDHCSVGRSFLWSSDDKLLKTDLRREAVFTTINQLLSR